MLACKASNMQPCIFCWFLCCHTVNPVTPLTLQVEDWGHIGGLFSFMTVGEGKFTLNGLMKSWQKLGEIAINLFQ